MAKREGFHTVTPYIVLKDAAAGIEFYKKAFGATEISRHLAPDGGIMHAEIRIGDSPVMLVDECPEFPEIRAVQTYGGSPVQIFLYLDDVDAFAAQAVAAGVKLIGQIEDKDYGRAGGLTDPFGLIWWITTHK